MTALITLTDNIIAPNGEEYRAVWGEVKPLATGVTIGNVTIPEHAYLSFIPCPRPQKDTTPFTETKEGKLYQEKQVSDFPHIYYAD